MTLTAIHYLFDPYCMSFELKRGNLHVRCYGNHCNFSKSAITLERTTLARSGFQGSVTGCYAIPNPSKNLSWTRCHTNSLFLGLFLTWCGTFERTIFSSEIDMTGRNCCYGYSCDVELCQCSAASAAKTGNWESKRGKAKIRTLQVQEIALLSVKDLCIVLSSWITHDPSMSDY